MILMNILVVLAIGTAVVLAFIEDEREAHHRSEW